MTEPNGADRSSPEAVFATAGAATSRGDWRTLFQCLDNGDIERLARMSMSEAGMSDRVSALCRAHGVSNESLSALDRTAQALAESARTVTAAPDPQSMLIASNRHRQVLQEYEEAGDRCVAELTDAAGFVADTEVLRRETSGGGLVSSRLYVDELLTSVTIKGSRATATRIIGQHTESVRFTRRRDGWRINLFGR